jgi:hypothetical protein
VARADLLRVTGMLDVGPPLVAQGLVMRQATP